MARYFQPRTDILFRAVLIAIPLLAGALVLVAWQVQASSYLTDQDVVISQPVPFSHEHHVAGLGIDCRYCHTSAQSSAFPGMPSTRTCMTCHSQIWTNAELLQPVRDSFRDQKAIAWKKVHRLPGYVYFDHSAHVNKGVGCVTCHGRVDQMPLMTQAAPMTMSWCLDCHRNPAANLRPRSEVYSVSYVAPGNQNELGKQLARRYAVRSKQALMDCTTCHR